jgi:uncharacterized membrane protein YfcA
MPVIAIFFPVAIAIAITAFVHLMNNLFKLITLWNDIHWKIGLRFGIPALLSAIPGALLLTRLTYLENISNYMIFDIEATITPLKLIVGSLLIIFATVEFLSIAKKIQFTQQYLILGGMLSGFFGGLSGHQGAFRSAFLLRTTLDAKQFIATNAFIASLVDITRLIIYGININLLFKEVGTFLIVAATLAAFSGVLVGKMGIKKITISSIQKIVTLMLFILGALILIGIL